MIFIGEPLSNKYLIHKIIHGKPYVNFDLPKHKIVLV